MGEEGEPLVGGQAPGEADGEHVGVDRVGDLADVVGLLPAEQPVLLLLDADVLDQLRPRRAARRPQLLVGDRPDRLPRPRVGRAAQPALAEVPVEQPAEGGAEEGREVRAVGDVRDRHLGLVPEHVPPDVARDGAVELADPVPAAAQPDGELRHARLLGLVRRVGPEEADELALAEPQPPGQPAVRGHELLGRVRLVPGRDRRVRREDDTRAHGFERVLEARTGRDLLRRELERRERRMALVQVQDGRLDPERAQDAHPAHAQQAVLREPHLPARVVQASRRPLLHGVVVRDVGVEQQQRDAADVRAPDGEPEGGAEEIELQPERRSVRVRHPGDGQVVRLAREPVLLLPPRHVEPLAKVAAAVEEPDPHHGQRLVAGLLDDVAREHAQPARVEGQRRVDAELGAQERDRPGDAGARLVGAREIRRHVLGQRLDPRGERRVALGRRLRRRPEVVQEAHRVVPGSLPAESADVAEQRGPVRVPAPAVVVRDGGERLQPVDETIRQRSRAARQVLRAELSECRPHGSRLPHARARPRG